MTPWQIKYPVNLPFKYAVKNYDGNVKGLGFIKKGTVLLDDENKTLLSSEEWEQIKEDLQLIKILTTFKGKLLT